nr:MAG TPA: cytokine receptor common subunit [Bacteriophage sp.]
MLPPWGLSFIFVISILTIFKIWFRFRLNPT